MKRHGSKTPVGDACWVLSSMEIALSQISQADPHCQIGFDKARRDQRGTPMR